MILIGPDYLSFSKVYDAFVEKKLEKRGIPFSDILNGVVKAEVVVQSILNTETVSQEIHHIFIDGVLALQFKRVMEFTWSDNGLLSYFEQRFEPIEA